MNKLYEKIVTKGKVYEKFNFGTNINNFFITPQNALINQTNEINRLNATIDRLEKALDAACEELENKEQVILDLKGSLLYWKTKEEWKELLLEEDKNEIY